MRALICAEVCYRKHSTHVNVLRVCACVCVCLRLCVLTITHTCLCVRMSYCVWYRARVGIFVFMYYHTSSKVRTQRVVEHCRQ